MFITEPKTKVKAIRQGERAFTINDGFVLYPRASIQVRAGAPANVAQTLDWAIAQGYITAVAHVTEQEYTFIGLTQS